MFLGYRFCACKRFGWSDAHTRPDTYSNVCNWVWMVPQSMKLTLVLTWVFPGVEVNGCDCAANRAEAAPCGRGASLLKGSCNFHSRVLLKLVLRPLRCLNTFLPSCLVRPLTPQYPPHSSAAFHCTIWIHILHTCNLLWEGMVVCLFVCVGVWALIIQTTCTQQTIFWLQTNIDYRCGYGVYFFYAYS